jgi:hypothetical protein
MIPFSHQAKQTARDKELHQMVKGVKDGKGGSPHIF